MKLQDSMHCNLHYNVCFNNSLWIKIWKSEEFTLDYDHSYRDSTKYISC